MAKKEIDYKNLSEVYEQLIDKKNILIDLYKNHLKSEGITNNILMDLNKEQRREILEHKIDKITITIIALLLLIGLILK